MPTKPKPKPKPKKNLTEAFEQAAINSPIELPDSSPVVSASSRRGKRATKGYKSPSVVLSSDDEVAVVQEKAAPPVKKKPVPAVTVTKRKLKPGHPSREVVNISDSDEVVEDDGDDCEVDAPAIDEGEQVVSEDEDSLGGFIVDDDDVVDAEEEAKLVGGDTMFPEPKTSSARIQLKRSAPQSPPYETRKTTTGLETPTQSPTKKARSGPVSTPKTPSPEKPKRKVAFPKSASIHHSDNDGDLNADDNEKTLRPSPSIVGTNPFISAPTPNGFSRKVNKAAVVGKKPDIPKSDAKRSADDHSFDGLTEADMPGSDYSDTENDVQPTESTPANVTYHDDHNLLRIRSLPDVCAVSDPTTQDRFLREQGYYKDLPNLRAVTISPLKESVGNGLIRFSRWKHFIPEMPFLQLLKVVVFVKSGRFINPSRIDPLSISGRPASWTDTRIELCTGNNVTAICVSPVMIIDSYLDRLHSVLSFSGHFVTGVLHTQEFNRMVSLAGMLVNVDNISAQLWRDALTFGTKTQSPNFKEGSSKDTSNYKNMFQSSGSPIKSSGRKINTAINAIEPLDYGEKIPVYDAIGCKFECDENTFGNLAQHFRPFVGEIPPNSCAVVGYIMQLHKQANGTWRMYTYAKWILVLGRGK